MKTKTATQLASEENLRLLVYGKLPYEEVKKLIRTISLKDVEQLASKVLDFSTSDEVKEEAIRRVDICGGCSWNRISFCRQCGCWIPAKARSMKEGCPINKWNE